MAGQWGEPPGQEPLGQEPLGQEPLGQELRDPVGGEQLVAVLVAGQLRPATLASGIDIRACAPRAVRRGGDRPGADPRP